MGSCVLDMVCSRCHGHDADFEIVLVRFFESALNENARVHDDEESDTGDSDDEYSDAEC